MHHDESKPDDFEEVAPAREGDVLGLGGTALPKDPADRDTDQSGDAEDRGNMGVLGETEEEPNKKTAFSRP